MAKNLIPPYSTTAMYGDFYQACRREYFAKLLTSAGRGTLYGTGGSDPELTEGM